MCVFVVVVVVLQLFVVVYCHFMCIFVVLFHIFVVLLHLFVAGLCVRSCLVFLNGCFVIKHFVCFVSLLSFRVSLLLLCFIYLWLLLRLFVVDLFLCCR